MKITPRYFLPIFILLILLVFSLHLFFLSILNHSLFSDKIIESYLLNFLIAIIIYFLIYQFKDTFKNSLGFLFILGSFIKFLLFYALIYPSFKLDGDISKYEFASFFIPYFTCLIYETLAVSTLLNSLKN
jgi:hypothetical protein